VLEQPDRGDGGPHPNPAKAADGKRLHKLTIDEPGAAVSAAVGRVVLLVLRYPAPADFIDPLFTC
jgi:hypothetical protein